MNRGKHGEGILLSDVEQERLLVEVVPRVLARCGTTDREVERALFDTLYEERRRLDSEPDTRSTRAQSRLYDEIYSQAIDASASRQRELLRDVIEAFAHEVAGHFDPRVYALATRAIPTGLSVLLNASSPLKLVRALSAGVGSLDDRLVISGETEALGRLSKRGTVVLVPTHSSNLDSVLVGFALYRLGLPPFLYGAGLNLFQNRLVGFFMHNLGAYRVDRRKSAAVYKDVLKTYAGCALETGRHNLFFPGGTRSRSGAVERHLKLGLLGTTLESYIHNLRSERPSPDIYVVPCTINYQLVLEAETLIEDYLKAEGKSQYIIEDDEFSRPARVLDFVRKLFSMDSKIHIVIGRALDVFGNEVDDEGRSRDSRGRIVDRQRYVFVDGVPDVHPQRDREYTVELAHAIVDSYQRNTLVNSTNLLSRVVFRWLREQSGGADLYRLLRTGGSEQSVAISEVHERVSRALIVLRRLHDEGRLLLDDTLLSQDADRVVDEALAHLGTYHRRPAVTRRGDRLFHEDRNLLFFYQNRLDWLDGVEGMEDAGL